jgi:hypothetical protein
VGGFLKCNFIRRKAAPASEQLHWLAVYDGQQCIGHALSRGKLGVEAFDVENRSLGIFPSVKQALAAFDGGAP